MNKCEEIVKQANMKYNYSELEKQKIVPHPVRLYCGSADGKRSAGGRVRRTDLSQLHLQ